MIFDQKSVALDCQQAGPAWEVATGTIKMHVNDYIPVDTLRGPTENLDLPAHLVRQIAVCGYGWTRVPGFQRDGGVR